MVLGLLCPQPLLKQELKQCVGQYYLDYIVYNIHSIIIYYKLYYMLLVLDLVHCNVIACSHMIIMYKYSLFVN